mmetsp:Transcript_14137/g.21482  ORF Transcript_14137/g.21482 Transcript_14137/m.21482 type:complete len:203 (-) Transcript_14137:2433-3041(-)
MALRKLMQWLFLLLCSTSVASFEISLPGGRRVQYQDGILRIRLDDSSHLPSDIPTKGTPASKLTMESIVVRDTKTKKGYGAFATAPLSKHTFLGFYDGAVIEGREELDKIVSSRNSPFKLDYVLSLDGGATFLDGFERAFNRDIFSPVHLNHADKGAAACNCLRILEGGDVAFFTSRDVIVGEELCFDYGKDYWSSRENLKI